MFLQCFFIIAVLAPFNLAGYSYHFTLKKGRNVSPTTFNDKYYIPEGACSGEINSSMFPDYCRSPLALEVAVWDNNWVYFKMKDNLRSVAIYRKKDYFTQRCRGRATIAVKIACPQT